VSAAELAGGPPAQGGAPAPVSVAATYAPLPVELAPEAARAAIEARKADPAFMRQYLDGDPAATSVMTRLYGTAYDQAPAPASSRDPAPDRPSGYSLPLAPAGVAVDQQAAAPLMELAHAEGIGRAGFTVLAERTMALAGGQERPYSAEECGGALEGWFGEARAREVLAAAQRVAQRVVAGGDAEARAILTALSTDPYAVAALGGHELGKAGR
jgi:hypothetical protein